MTDLERRLRRIVRSVALLGVAAAIVGMVPGKHLDDIYTVEYAAPVGGVPLLLLIGATLLYAALLYVSPRRGVALAWAAWAALGLLTALGMAWNNHPLSGTDASWAAPAMHTLVAAMLVLVFPVTWIVALTSRAQPTPASPTARLVKG